MRIRLERSSRRLGWPAWLVAVVAGWITAVLAVHWLAERRGATVVLCPLKLLTGLPCPACGSTRGAFALLHGHAAEAWRFNPLIMTAAVVAAALLAVRLAAGRSLRLSLSRRERIAAWALAVAAVLANWAYVIRMVG